MGLNSGSLKKGKWGLHAAAEQRAAKRYSTHRPKDQAVTGAAAAAIISTSGSRIVAAAGLRSCVLAV